jgi:sulfite reductase beta subunit-like hemoprotein
VRNITSCPYAGVSHDEVFDITPYAEAMTRYFLGHPLSGVLPRKFKIAFEGCPEDHALASIHDLGWFARIVDGRRGFRLTIAGGTSILPVSGYLLYEFLPEEQMLEVAEAIVRVYHRFGDYEHRQRNRMKFLIRQLGWDGWRAKYDEALAEVRKEGGVPFKLSPEALRPEEAPYWPATAAPVHRGREAHRGKRRSARSRHHAGYGEDSDVLGFVPWVDAYERGPAEAARLRSRNSAPAARRHDHRARCTYSPTWPMHIATAQRASRLGRTSSTAG